MNRYTIHYQYGPYSGTMTVWADDGEDAVARMWRRMRPSMTLPMAGQSAKIVDVEYGAEG